MTQNFRFLNNKHDLNSTGDVVAFMSYPRSGNSFLRRYLELITGIYTGSDIQIDMCLSLQQMGLLGEQTVDGHCWINKTHSPVPFPRAW